MKGIMAKEYKKAFEKDAPEAATAGLAAAQSAIAAAPPPKIVLPPPARFEIRTPLAQFSGKRGETTAWNTTTGKLEHHAGVQIKNGVGWTDDELVSSECLRIGYSVTDHHNEGK